MCPKLKFALSDPDLSKRMEAFKSLGQALGQLPEVLGRLEAVKGEMDPDKLPGDIRDGWYKLKEEYNMFPSTSFTPTQSTGKGEKQPSGRKGGTKRQGQPTPSGQPPGGGFYERMRKEVEENMKRISDEILKRQKVADNESILNPEEREKLYDLRKEKVGDRGGWERIWDTLKSAVKD